MFVDLLGWVAPNKLRRVPTLPPPNLQSESLIGPLACIGPPFKLPFPSRAPAFFFFPFTCRELHRSGTG